VPAENRSLELKILSDLPGPQVTLLRGLLTAEESRHIISRASAQLRDKRAVAEADVVTKAHALGKTSWLDMRMDDDPVLIPILKRLRWVTGLSLSSAEPMLVTQFTGAEQGRYAAHFDWGHSTQVERDFPASPGSGARLATLQIYLNDVEEGGQTLFNSQNMSVAPEEGSALFWYNLRSSKEGDQLVKHAECRTHKGDKFVATIWFHETGNEALYTAHLGATRSPPALPRFSRNWERLVDGQEDVSAPFVLRHADLPCKKRVQRGECDLEPLPMARACPGSCEDMLISSSLRGRVVMDNVIEPELSNTIVRLAPNASVPGDGYGGNQNPFSQYEIFGGISPVSAATWARSVPADQRQEAFAWVRAYIRAARLMKQAIEDHFGVRDLMFDYIHLTCRTRLHPSVDADYESHPAHSDNCFRRGLECIRDSPFFHWRTHSAVLYMHGPESGDFEGGNFYFTPDWHAPRVLVRPKAGRMIAFTSGDSNIHGVQKITRGVRCALNIWLTDQGERASFRQELERAEDILRGKNLEAPDEHTYRETYARLCKPETFVPPPVSKTVEVPLTEENRSLSIDVVETPSEDGPQVAIIKDLVDAEEIKHILQKATPNLKAATVYENGQLVTAKYRSSTSAWLKDDPDDATLTRILNRIHLVTGISLLSSEELQVAYYNSDNLGKYEPHFDAGRTDHQVSVDYNDPDSDGDRVATLLIYLNDVELGGQTVFTSLGFGVTPSAGTALFWYNLKPDGEKDIYTRHGGCPTLKGEKYIATKWTHEYGNEYLFHAAAGREHFRRSWDEVAARALVHGSQPEPLSRPLVLGYSCAHRRENDECRKDALAMAKACPGTCEDLALESSLRGRAAYDGGIVPDADVKLLAELAPQAVVPGDGYAGNAHPSSRNERFSGATPLAAAHWALKQGPLATAWARAYINAARMLRTATEAHFKLEGQLSFDYIQLNCRERVGQVNEATGIDGHEAHADNCWFRSRECHRTKPFPWWRSHVAMLFLQNHSVTGSDGAFKGGEFFYQPNLENRSGRAFVRPRAGRFLTFTAGVENMNGVAEILHGRRCVLQIWLTDDKSRAAAVAELEEAAAVLDGAGSK